MMFKQLDMDDPTISNRFALKQNDYIPTWDHYYRVYNHAFSQIIAHGLTQYYAFNPAAHALMFLLRHTLELNLKYNLSLMGKHPPNTHELTALVDEFDDPSFVPVKLLEGLKVFKEDLTGDSWRYSIDRSNEAPFFRNQDRITLASILQGMNSIPSTAKYRFTPLSEAFSYEDGDIACSLTLYIGQCQNDWHVKGEYDEVTQMLIDMVRRGKVVIGKVYLPLLFCIRHGIELALKGNIAAVQPVSDAISQREIRGEHSLWTLYSVFRDYLDRLDMTKLRTHTYEQYKKYRLDYDLLNNSLHQLDSHSRTFRYPFDKNGKPHILNLQKIRLSEIVKLYQLNDRFLTFTTNVLIDNDLLDFSPDIHG